jgi:adenylate kinase
MKNIIFIAPPAAGKGTQSKLVSAEYNIPHISTGDLLREEVNSGSDLGAYLKQEMDKGNLISDETITTLLKNRLSKSDCENGYILDGYPRNVTQAKIYENLLKELNKEIGSVIFLDIDKSLALERTLSRIVCPNCGASYNLNIEALKPIKEGICDKCNNTLKIRSDDNKETFLNRFDTYINNTKELIDYYDKLGVLSRIKINKEDSAQDIFNEIKKIII